jgi:WD40 repeat protein
MGASFGPEGKTLVVGGSGGYDVWDLETSSNTFIPSHSVKYLFGCIFDPLGRWIYVSDYQGDFRILSSDGKRVLPIPGSPYARHVIAFDVTPDGKCLAMCRGGFGSNRVEVWKIKKSGAFSAAWSLRDGKLVSVDEPYLLNDSTWCTDAVAITSNGKIVAISENRAINSPKKPLIVLRDGRNGDSIQELGRTETSWNGELVFSADGQVLYAWNNQVLEKWDLKLGKRTKKGPAPGRSYFLGLKVHPSGEFVLTVSGDGQVRYWDSVTLTPMKSLHWKIGKLHSLAICPNGLLACAGGEKGKVVIWDVDE